MMNICHLINPQVILLSQEEQMGLGRKKGQEVGRGGG